MRTFDANNELVLFWSLLLKVVISGTLTDTVSQRIEDQDGVDISHLVRNLTIEQNQMRAWAQLELNRPGFDGPFCTPQVSWDKLIFS